MAHIWGNLANMSALIKLCKKRNIKVIEDAAESIGSKYNLRKKVHILVQ